jgi:hypothetical protein
MVADFREWCGIMLDERNPRLSSAGTYAVGRLQISGTAWVELGI